MLNLQGIPEEIAKAYLILQEFLLTNYPDAKKAAGGSETVKRCHYCGDSRTLSSRHLYIGINKQYQIVYNCFKCGTSGMVDHKFFRDLGVFDVDLITTVVNANRLAFSLFNRSSGYIKKSKLYCAPILSYIEDDRTAKKLNYLNNRLGQYIPTAGMQSLKIIPNLKEYLLQNRIGYFSRHQSIIDELDLGFMGFLSVDNSHIIMRRLVPEDKVHPSLKERYNIYNIYPNVADTVNFYVIPGAIDPMLPIHIYMAEGPFDILGVYFNVPHEQNAIFGAASGKGNYGSLLEYIYIGLGVPSPNSHIHIYSDNDISQRDLQNIKSILPPMIPADIHFNNYPGEKDFGVRKELINESVVRL